MNFIMDAFNPIIIMKKESKQQSHLVSNNRKSQKYRNIVKLAAILDFMIDTLHSDIKKHFYWILCPWKFWLKHLNNVFISSGSRLIEISIYVWQPFWILWWLHYTHILKTSFIEFYCPENMGIGTKIIFLSHLRADLWKFQYMHGGHFEKCLPNGKKWKFFLAPYLILFSIPSFIITPNFIIINKKCTIELFWCHLPLDY